MLTGRRVGLAVSIALALTFIVGATSQQAQANPFDTTAAVGGNGDGPPVCDIDLYQCEKKHHGPGTQPTPQPGGGSGGGKTAPCLSASGTQLPCSSSWGNWSNDLQCYLRPDPKPASAPPANQAGRYYICHRLDRDPLAGGTEYSVWVNEPPSVDPGRLALDLLARLQLQKIKMGTTPEEGKTGLLGLPTYLWVDNPGPRTLGPISDSDTQGNVTVSLTAKVDHVTWNLGDSTTITCTGAGTPYQDSFGAAPSPTCGHMYRKPSTGLPGGSYPVTATAVWQVDWTGGGEAGSIPFQITSTSTVRISEAQALN